MASFGDELPDVLISIVSFIGPLCWIWREHYVQLLANVALNSPVVGAGKWKLFPGVFCPVGALCINPHFCIGVSIYEAGFTFVICRRVRKKRPVHEEIGEVGKFKNRKKLTIIVLGIFELFNGYSHIWRYGAEECLFLFINKTSNMLDF